jgi:hypothetical protein
VIRYDERAATARDRKRRGGDAMGIIRLAGMPFGIRSAIATDTGQHASGRSEVRIAPPIACPSFVRPLPLMEREK